MSKNVYIDKLDDIVNKYNNTYHRTIIMKPAEVKSSTYVNSSKETNDKAPKFEIGDVVGISKYKNIFGKGYVPNWPEEFFVIEKVKNTVPCTYVISDVKGQEIDGLFYEKELKIKKTNQKEFRVEKVIKKKGDKLYAKCKGYNISFNSWVVKKDIIQTIECFSEPKSSGGRVKVELDLFDYSK